MKLMCVSQIDLRKLRARQAPITNVFCRMYKQCAVGDILKFNSSGQLSLQF